MHISPLERRNPLITGKMELKSITEKVSAVGTHILHYFVRNKYALALSVWTYALIEVSIATSDRITSGNYVYDAASCRRTLCEYANQYTHTNHTSEEVFNLIEICDLSPKDFSLSFMECLHDLCIFLEHVGEKFYACVGNFSQESNLLENKILSDPKITPMKFWNSVCPKRHLKRLTNIKKLAYFRDCLKYICVNNEIVSILNDETRSLCNNTVIEDIHTTLKLIKRYLRKLTKVNAHEEESENWERSNAISNIIISITSVLSSAAAIGATIITCRTGTRVSMAVKKTSDSLSSALQSLNVYTKSSIRALAQQVLNILSDNLPVSAIESLQGLSEIIQEEGSSVYYSASEVGSISVQDGNPHIADSSMNSRMDSAAKAILGASGSQAIGFVSAVDTAGKVLKTGIRILGNGAHSSDEIRSSDFMDATSSITEETWESTTSTVSDPDYCITYYLFESSQPLKVVRLWVDCLKASLPSWNGAYCFYNRAINFLACRLPSSVPKKDYLIAIPSIEIPNFFSENTEILCHTFNEIIWCNWNKFLDLSFFKRSVSFFDNEDCPWDQFALKVHEYTNDGYNVEAIGKCYNQTAFIKA